jgi:hypothetical protein
MSNAVEARKVVFELFQDLDSFRLDDYKAMGDPEEGMSALVRFITETANAEDETFTRCGDNVYAWIDRESHVKTLLTTQRELSFQKENVQLIGLDHPLVATFLKKYRELPPEELGVCVGSPDGTEGVFAAWAVEARGDKGQNKRMVIALAVDSEGKRHVAWERQPDMLWKSAVFARRISQADQRLALLRSRLEPMLQQELEHRGLDKVNRGFESKLIAWVEAVVSRAVKECSRISNAHKNQ